jgi:hypothetical protein
VTRALCARIARRRRNEVRVRALAAAVGPRWVENTEMRPRARSEGLVIRDRRRDVARLAQPSVLSTPRPFRVPLADGRRTVADLAALLGQGADHALVHAASSSSGRRAGDAPLGRAGPTPRAAQAGRPRPRYSPWWDLAPRAHRPGRRHCIPAASCNAENVGRPATTQPPPSARLTSPDRRRLHSQPVVRAARIIARRFSRRRGRDRAARSDESGGHEDRRVRSTPAR